jgi:D-lactate dehydrogenase (cytochrome)
MFRQSSAHLRRLASPLLKRGGYRFRATTTEQNFKTGSGYKPFWNSGRVLLFSAVTGTTTYFYGANDEPMKFHIPWRRAPGPQYANKHEMERASS